ncbi:uncharacterized protein [Ptychodera flava]|uniref:uncharacterized protein n=1 Tax=Ptychodera flava TaxID=63121 RepID=UPI00396A0A42
MDPQFGTMTVAEDAHFEWETKEVYDLVATATDGGGLIGYANVTVYVIDTIITVDMFIMPSSSPIEGNTTVDVSFDDCVKNCSDFENITVLNITLAGVPCSEWVDMSTNGTIWIQCVTLRIDSTRSGVVRVDTMTEVGDRFLLSATDFYYKDPTITDFEPKIGPQSGGTTITIEGKDLDAGSVIDVHIDHLPCEVERERITDEAIVCTNVRAEKLFTSVLKVEFDQAVRYSEDEFEYMDDPVIEVVEPLRATVEGGSTQVITGTNLHTIAEPQMTTTVVSATIYEILITNCTVHNETHMTCPSAEIPVEYTEYHRQRRETGQSCEDSIIVRDPYGNEIHFYIGFIMDGVETWTNLSSTLPEYSQMNITLNPEYDTNTGLRIHNPDESEYLTITGQRLSCGNTIVDLTVLVGHDNCYVISLFYDELICRAPRTQPPSLNRTSDYPEIIVIISDTRTEFIGHVKYVFNELAWWIMVVVIVTACLGTVLIAVLVMVSIYRYKRRLDEERARKNRAVETFLVFGREEDSEEFRNNYLYQSVESGESARRMLLDSLHEEMKGDVESVLIDHETSGMKMTVGKELGSGHFGKVYLGDLTDKSGCTTGVAVKVLQKYSPSQSDINDFLLEGTIMKDFQHHNVLTLIGIYIDIHGSPYIIIPYMANGDLRTYILNTEHHFKQAVLIDFGLQVARGMDYLGGKKFVHRDLAARNCMVDGQMVVKVADFGLSRDIYEKEYYVSENKRALPVKWMAPECLTTQHFDAKSDVWSFGVLLWEVMTRGATPYAGIDNLDLMRHLKRGNRLPMPRYLSTKLYNVMRRCWCTSPEYRPTFAELVEDLDEILLNDEHLDDPASDDIFTKSYLQLIPNRQRDEDDDFSSDEDEFSSGDEWIEMKEMPLEEQASYLKVRQANASNSFDANMECETLLMHDDHGNFNSEFQHTEFGGEYTKLAMTDPGGFIDIEAKKRAAITGRNSKYTASGRTDKCMSSVGDDGYMTKVGADEFTSVRVDARYVLPGRGNTYMRTLPRDGYMMTGAKDSHETGTSDVKYGLEQTGTKAAGDRYTKLQSRDAHVVSIGQKRHLSRRMTDGYMDTLHANEDVTSPGTHSYMALGGNEMHGAKGQQEAHMLQGVADGYMETFPTGGHAPTSDNQRYMALEGEQMTLGREHKVQMEANSHVFQGGADGYMDTFPELDQPTSSTSHSYMPLGRQQMAKFESDEQDRHVVPGDDGYMDTYPTGGQSAQLDYRAPGTNEQDRHVVPGDDGYMDTYPTGGQSAQLDYRAPGTNEQDRHVVPGDDGYMDTYPTGGQSAQLDYRAPGTNEQDRHVVPGDDGYMDTYPTGGQSAQLDYRAPGTNDVIPSRSQDYMPFEQESGRYIETNPSDRNSTEPESQYYSSLGKDRRDMEQQVATPGHREYNRDNEYSKLSRSTDLLIFDEEDDGMIHATGTDGVTESYMGTENYLGMTETEEIETSEEETDDYDLLERSDARAPYGEQGTMEKMLLQQDHLRKIRENDYVTSDTDSCDTEADDEERYFVMGENSEFMA